METIKAIMSRRSIRKYKDTEITNDTVEVLLRAGMYAPSARNTQPWHFIVVQDREILNRIREVHPYASMLDQAPLAICVCGDKRLEPNEGYISINCSAATENIMLAAYDAGLGTVWLGVYPRKERMNSISKLFELPDYILPVSIIVAGEPDETAEQPERYIREKIHMNEW
jgi:nitroreductase